MKSILNLFFRNREKYTLLYHYKKIVKDIKEGKILTRDGDKFSPSTIANYRSGYHQFSLYEKERGTIFLHDIDLIWAEEFRVFLTGKGYCKNTIGATLRRLKAVLNRLFEAGKCSFNGAGILANHELVTTTYNTINDLQQLLDFDFKDCNGQKKVRDIYVLHCFLGLRFSDFNRFLNEPRRYLRSVGTSWFIEMKTEKTGEDVIIPIGRTPMTILQAYSFDFGDTFSFQYYNATIKEIAFKAGITQEIVFSRTEGGIRKDVVKEKSTMLSSHTARRTFATNAFLSGLPEKNIMQITGHKTYASFQRYIRCSNLEAAISIAQHDFFKIELSAIQYLSSHNSDILSLNGHESTILPG